MWQDILKMPIVSRIVPTKDGNGWKSKFIDPESNETLHIGVQFSDDEETIEGYISDEEGTRTTSLAEKISDDKFMAKDIRTKEPFMRRGYAENLYHLVNYALVNRGFELIQDTSQSGEASSMWEKNSEYGSWNVPDEM